MFAPEPHRLKRSEATDCKNTHIVLRSHNFRVEAMEAYTIIGFDKKLKTSLLPVAVLLYFQLETLFSCTAVFPIRNTFHTLMMMIICNLKHRC